LCPNIFLSTPFSKTLSLCLHPTSMRRAVSRPSTTGKITVHYIIIFIFFDNEKILNFYSQGADEYPTWNK
jgi:hypothetical protein